MTDEPRNVVDQQSPNTMNSPAPLVGTDSNNNANIDAEKQRQASPQVGTGATTSAQAAGKAESAQALIDAKVEAEKKQEADRVAQAAEAKRVAGIKAERGGEQNAAQKASEEADAKKGDEAARSNKPFVGSPLVGGNPAMAKPIDGPTVHGEAAQRFVNKNAAHSERVLHGNVVTPPVRKERYEHPERKA